MKTEGKGILLILAVMFINMAAMLPDEFENIASAIRVGDAHTISMYFDKTVDIKTDDKSITYSKNQAELVLKEFFQKNNPHVFTIIHRGASAKGAKYIIGTLETSTGKFRSFVYMKESGGKQFIEEMSFEKQ
jgi:hypothetical protein